MQNVSIIVKSKQAIFCTILSALIFGITPLFVKLIYQAGMDVMSVTFYRGLLPSAFLFMIGKIKKENFKISLEHLFSIVITGVFGNTLTSVFLNSSYLYLDIGTAKMLHFMYPFMVSLLCVFFFNEKMSRKRIGALSVALLGLLCFMQLDSKGSIIGIFLAILSSLTYAFYMVMIGKKRLNRISPTVLTFYLSLVMIVTSLAFSVFSGGIDIPETKEVWIHLLIFTLSSQILGVIFLQIGIQKLGAVESSIISLLEPLVSIIAGFLFLQERISVLEFIGSLIIIGSIFIFISKEKSRE